MAGAALSMAAASAQVTGVGPEPTVATPFTSNIPPGASNSWDDHYGVCRGPDPRCYHPWLDKTRPDRVLIYSRTTGPRHASTGTALAAGLNPPLNANNVMQAGLIQWLAAEGITADWTEDVSRIANLNTYKAVIFANTSRDALFPHGRANNPTFATDTTNAANLDAAKTNLMQYMRAGGAVVAIHNATATEYEWPYFRGLLGNAQYYDHGAHQDGVVYLQGTDSSTAGLPSRWTFRDEFYNFVPYPDGVKFVAMVDASTLATKSAVHPGHGKAHPVAWCQYYDGGRVFVTSLGHDTNAFVDGSGLIGQAEFKRLVVQGIKSAMGMIPFCRS
jgi:type 1 glutamine amidotransferase